MIINIKELLSELISNTVITDSSISSQGKTILSQMKESAQASTQGEMISLFLGGTIYAMHQDQVKYGYRLGASEIANKVRAVNPKIEEEVKDTMLLIGNYIIANLPQSLSAKLYLIQRKPSSYSLRPYFPDLANNVEKIDYLLKFCEKYNNDLEQEEFNTDEFLADETIASNQTQTFKNPSSFKKNTTSNYSPVSSSATELTKSALTKPENVEKILTIVNTLIGNISHKKAGRETWFDSNSDTKVAKLTAISNWLSKQETLDRQSQQVLVALIRDVCKEKRNCLGIFQPHSLDEFNSMMAKKNLIIPDGISFSPTQLLALNRDIAVDDVIKSAILSIPSNENYCVHVDISDEDLKNATYYQPLFSI
jgi:hypothetical protein